MAKEEITKSIIIGKIFIGEVSNLALHLVIGRRLLSFLSPNSSFNPYLSFVKSALGDEPMTMNTIVLKPKVSENIPTTNEKIVVKEEEKKAEIVDSYLGARNFPTRQIPGTPYFVSRRGNAAVPEKHEPRLNPHGYDQDDPKDAITKFEKAHPLTFGQELWRGFSDAVFNFLTLFGPKLLSLSAGDKKQRIDQKVVLDISRDAVDKFPELKIRMSKADFDLLDAKDQMRWHKEMAIIRAAQHDYIINKLAEAYPGHIDTEAPTILYTGGRATGLLRVLNVSVDEYLALYWSDWGLSSTDSGSYRSHVYDYIIEGQNINWNASFLDYNPNDFEVTEPGEYTFLGSGDRKVWSFEGPCGMLDHGIGDIISMTKFALVSNFFSTLNMDQVGKLLSNEAQAVAHEYAQRLKDALGFNAVTVKPAQRVTDEELAQARQYFSQIVERMPNVG